MREDYERIVKAFFIIKDKVKEVVDNMNIKPSLLSCIEAYILNSMMVPIVSSIRKGKDIDIDKHVLRIKKLLSKEDRISKLITICNLYNEILTENPNIIVDVGCGLGLNLIIAKNYIDHPRLLLGIDKDLYFLKVLKKIANDVDVIQADALMLPLREESIDVIFCTAVIHELPNLKAIDEFNRILKNNGITLISDIVLRYIPQQIPNAIRRIKIKLGMEPETFYTYKQLYSKIQSLKMNIKKSITFRKALIIGIAVIIATKTLVND